MGRLVVLVAVLLASIPLPSFAAPRIDNSPGSYSISAFSYIGGAAQQNNEYVLTANLPEQYGHVVSQQGFCANEWEVTWEAYAGEDGVDTGAGVGMFASNGAHEVSEWLEAVSPGAVDTLKSFAAGAGTSIRPGRTSDNYLELVDFLDSSKSTSINNPYFRFKGAGWFRNTMRYRKDGSAVYTVSNQAGATWTISGRLAHQPALPFHLGFYGKTDQNTNGHKVRNIGFRIINEGRCGLISSDEARVRVSIMCGTPPPCVEWNTYLTCASNALVSLRDTEEVISQATFDLLTDELEAKAIYCDGYNQCSTEMKPLISKAYDNGFTAGAASIDQSAIYNSGYTVGKDDGYAAGFAAGSASGTTQGYQAGYEAGYESGKAAGTELGKAQGLEMGLEQGYQSGFSAGNQAALATLAAEKQRSYDQGFADGVASVQPVQPEPHDLCANGATEIRWFSPGFGVGQARTPKNGSQPERALGLPNIESAAELLTLGRGGMIELGFGGRVIVDQVGKDFAVRENVSLRRGKQSCKSHPEFVEVFVTSDGRKWKSLGSYCGSVELDIAESGLSSVSAVRLLDKTLRPSLDGYDLAGIGCSRTQEGTGRR